MSNIPQASQIHLLFKIRLIQLFPFVLQTVKEEKET